MWYLQTDFIYNASHTALNTSLDLTLLQNIVGMSLDIQSRMIYNVPQKNVLGSYKMPIRQQHDILLTRWRQC